jgi:cytochrome c
VKVLLAAACLVLLSACAPANPSTSSAPSGGGPTLSAAQAQQAQQLIAQKGCGACHTIPGVPGATGNIGPNLAGVASRTTIAGGVVPNNGPDDLQRWLLDPPAVKPGTAMPKLGLTDDEARTIVAYLETLR